MCFLSSTHAIMVLRYALCLMRAYEIHLCLIYMDIGSHWILQEKKQNKKIMYMKRTGL
jgi:hypothetical protein